MGLWSTNAARLLRDRRRLGADGVAIFMNISPEFASNLGSRDAPAIARSVAVSSLPDCILVSGPMAGAIPDESTVAAVREAVPKDVPVVVNTGANAENVTAYLGMADGVIVGSALKRDGYTWNPVDPDRVKEFVGAVRKAEPTESQKMSPHS